MRRGRRSIQVLAFPDSHELAALPSTDASRAFAVPTKSDLADFADEDSSAAAATARRRGASVRGPVRSEAECPVHRYSASASSTASSRLRESTSQYTFNDFVTGCTVLYDA
mmetsp:Transcript_25400/g.60446  ORF Transcript_25400/g.60446 Transcript_25400/m.60446 type:complete len:111 (-) Transcript_25400:804-1136(-)